MDVEAQGVETEEQRHPAQVADDRFLVLEHPSQHIVLVGFGVVVTDEEDRTVGEGTAHQEDGDVLVVGVEGSLGGVVLRDECVGRQRIHMLCHQAGDHTEGRQSKTQLEVQRVVDGVVEALVTGTEGASERGALGWVMGFEDLADRVTDTEVGPVHVASDHKQTTDRQVVMGNVREPESFGLGVETTKEGEDRGAGTGGGAEDLIGGVGVLGVDAPVAGEEGSKTRRVRRHREEIVPTHVHTAGFRDRHVNQVTGPGDGAETKQNRQVVVEAGFSVLEPGQGRQELGLKVKPAGEQGPGRQDHHEDGTLVKLGVGGHADRVPPVVQTGIGDVHRGGGARLGEGGDGALAEVGIPDRVSDGTDVQRIGDPLLEVALPGDMEQVARNPEADDRQVTEVGGKQLLIKPLLRHSVMALEVVSRGDAVPNTTGCRVLCQTLAERRKFRCHWERSGGGQPTATMRARKNAQVVAMPPRR